MFLPPRFGGVIFCIALILLSTRLSAQDRFELPYVSLSQSPQFEKIQELPLTDEIRAAFKTCLSEVEGTEIPVQFFEQDLWRQFWDLNPGYLGTSEGPLLLPSPLTQLLSMGPVIVPLLLENLDNDLPVKAKLTLATLSSVRFLDRLHGNAANLREARILKLSKSCYVGSFEFHKKVPGRSVAATQADSYQFCVGDVCFVLLGRIVGRDYRPLIGLDAFTYAVCSTVFNDQMRIKVQALWGSATPVRAVYESLMYDFVTVGITGNGARDEWAQGDVLQITAALRLIKYFPASSQHAMQRRLNSLYLTNAREESDRVNGVDVAHLIMAIGTTDNSDLLERIVSLQINDEDEPIRTAVQWVKKKWTALQMRI